MRSRPPPLPDPAADDPLGGAIGFGARRHGVHFGGVEQVDAAIERAVDLCVPLGFGVLFAEGHGAEAEQAHLQPSAPQIWRYPIP
jgi:hypothetical protein